MPVVMQTPISCQFVRYPQQDVVCGAVKFYCMINQLVKILKINQQLSDRLRKKGEKNAGFSFHSVKMCCFSLSYVMSLDFGL